VACRCPLGTHTDSKASLIVTPEKNLWHCLGCDAGGDVIELVMALDQVPFREAVERLLPAIELNADQFRGPGERSYPPLLAEG
jgi:DNA primase